MPELYTGKRKVGQENSCFSWRLGNTVYRYALKTEVGYIASAIRHPDGTWREVGPEGIEASKHRGVDRFLRMLAELARRKRTVRLGK